MLPHEGFLASLSRFRLCFADTQNYALFDLETSEFATLAPVSSSGQQSRLKPCIASVLDPKGEENGFLIANHDADRGMGFFMNESGSPCRGTLEWKGGPLDVGRSLARIVNTHSPRETSFG
jgi:vacuolar protein sorting-associated protein 3